MQIFKCSFKYSYMLKNSKLTFVLESLMTRYRIGSFLVGDQIKFLDSIENNEIFKKLPVSELEMLKDIIAQQRNGDAIVKIVSLNSTPWIQGTPEAAPLSFDIGLDAGGGRFLTVVTLPGELINEIERINNDGINLPETIPANRKVTYTNEPPTDVEVSTEDEEGEDSAAIPNKEPARKMPTKDNKLGNEKTPTEEDPKKGIKSTMEVNRGKIDTKAKA